MNFRQFEYFLTVADYRSISEAAKHLFMTQSALGRQIHTLEMELNIQIFYRGGPQLKLTPAGSTLNEDLRVLLRNFKCIIEKARGMSELNIRRLNIGILEGHQLGELFPAIYDNFRTQHPCIQVDTHRCSFGRLADELFLGKTDIIVTLDFDIKGRKDILFREISTVHNYLVVPITHRLADKQNLTISDFKDDVFIVNSPDDTQAGYQNLVDECKQSGFDPKLKLADSLDEYMLWLEIGYGVAVLSEHNTLIANPSLRFLSTPKLPDAAIVVAYLKDNENPTVKVFIEIVDKLVEERNDIIKIGSCTEF